jgi:plasmid replication initiation protein
MREFTLYGTCIKSGKPEVITTRWVSAISYVAGVGVVKLQFSGVVIPFITRLETEFTRYKLEQIAGMSSPYAIRVYEMLIQWGGKGKREVEIVWIRERLMLQDEYQALTDFKKRVIDVAVDQINKHSDLKCEYTQKKTGRNVTHLIFEFAPKVPVEAKPKTVKKAAVSVKTAPVEVKPSQDIPKVIPKRTEAEMAAVKAAMAQVRKRMTATEENAREQQRRDDGAKRRRIVDEEEMAMREAGIAAKIEQARRIAELREAAKLQRNLGTKTKKSKLYGIPKLEDANWAGTK